MQQIFTTTNQ